MASHVSLFLLLFISFLTVQQAVSSGNVEILFNKFRLTNSDDRCCSCNNFVEKCDVYFELCLTYYKGPHCMFTRIFKGVYHDMPDISFTQKDKLTLPLPMRTFSIRVKISDEDFFVDDYVDTVQVYMGDVNPTPNGEKGNYSLYSMKGDRSILDLKVRSYCDEAYFGDRCSQWCVPNVLGGHTCQEGQQTCDDNGYFLTLRGVVDESNLQHLQAGLVTIVQQLGGVKGKIQVTLSTNVEEIDPGVKGTVVLLCMSTEHGPVLLENLHTIFEDHDDEIINSYLPLKVYRYEEPSTMPVMVDNGGDGSRTDWASKHWYVIFIVILLIVIIVVVAVVVAVFLMRRKKRQQAHQQFWRCHSGQNKRSEFDIGYDNPYYHKTSRASDVIDNDINNHRVSTVSDVTSERSENHYEDLSSLS